MPWSRPARQRSNTDVSERRNQRRMDGVAVLRILTRSLVDHFRQTRWSAKLHQLKFLIRARFLVMCA